jgi:putative transposase
MLPAPRSPDGRTIREDQPILAGHGGTNSIIPVTNPLERLNKEIKRRADVVGIFPNDEAIVRLVGALMLEQSDEWAVSRRYFSLESLASLTDTDALKLPAVAA